MSTEHTEITSCLEIDMESSKINTCVLYRHSMLWLFFITQALFYIIFTFSLFGIFRQQALFHVLAAYSMYNVVSLLFKLVNCTICVLL